jgi:hypothetical protein
VAFGDDRKTEGYFACTAIIVSCSCCHPRGLRLSLRTSTSHRKGEARGACRETDPAAAPRRNSVANARGYGRRPWGSGGADPATVTDLIHRKTRGLATSAIQSTAVVTVDATCRSKIQYYDFTPPVIHREQKCGKDYSGHRGGAFITGTRED